MEVVADNEWIDRNRLEAILNSAAEGLKGEEEVIYPVSKLPEILSERDKDVKLGDIATVSGFVLKNFSEGWKKGGLYNLQRNFQYREGELKDLREEDFENILKDYAGTKLLMAMKPVLERYEGNFEALQNYLTYRIDRAMDPVIDEMKEVYGEMFTELREREKDFEKMYR